MLAKVIITISIVLSPLFSVARYPLTKQNLASIASINTENISLLNSREVKQQWEKWSRYHQSSISALLISNPNFLPIRNWNIKEPEINARAAVVFNPLHNKFLYQKDGEEILPIASLTKIMTALISIECLDFNETVVISDEAYSAYGNQGGLMVNEKISVKDLFYVMLMESSNDASLSLAESCEQKLGIDFIDLMNQKAKELGLEKTFFVDPSGYDSENVSTAKEIAKLFEYSFNYPFIWQVLKTPVIDLISISGQNHHLVNTDKLLEQMPDIIGGKTGYTTMAQGCLVIALESESNQLITVILGAEDRFLETKKLINWAKEAYLWK